MDKNRELYQQNMVRLKPNRDPGSAISLRDLLKMMENATEYQRPKPTPKRFGNRRIRGQQQASTSRFRPRNAHQKLNKLKQKTAQYSRWRKTS